MVLLAAPLLLLAYQAEDQILFQSNFSDLETTWEILDDSNAKGKSSQWQRGLVELSGIANRSKKIATALLAGDKADSNYAVETSYFHAGSTANLTGIIFGYQDPEHFFIVGYNFAARRFELEGRTPEGYEILSFNRMDFPQNTVVSFRLEYAGKRIRFKANDVLIFDLDDDRYPRGRFGLGTSARKGARLINGQITVTSLPPEALPARAPQVLLSERKGGQCITAANQNAFKSLIDHQDTLTKSEQDHGGGLSLNLEKYQLPQEGVFAFPQSQSVEIHKIGLQLNSYNFPGKVEFLVSEDTPDGEFRTLGILDVRQERQTLQELVFDPVRAKYLKVRVLSAVKAKYVHIQEMYVYGYFEGSGPADPASSGASGEKEEILFQDDFSSGNLDLWQVWNDPDSSVKKSQWVVALSEYSDITNGLGNPATMLLNGDTSWKNYSVQTDMHVSQRDGALTGLIFGHQNAESYYMAGYNFVSSRFELAAFTTQGVEILAQAEMPFPRKEWVSLKVDFYGERVLFHVNDRAVFDCEDGRFLNGRFGLCTSALDQGYVLVDKIEVSSLAKQTPPEKQLQDLLSAKKGAAVIYRSEPPMSEEFRDMIDHSLENPDHMGNTYELRLENAPLPEEAVFCFPQGRFVDIQKIGFHLGNRGLPQEVKFWVSEQTPKSGFEPLATLTLENKPNSYQEFSVDGKKVKYLKIQITKAFGNQSVGVKEMLVKGHFQDLALKSPGEEFIGEIQSKEKEPNNSIQQAQALPLSTYLGGEVDGEDKDYFKISLPDPGNTLNLKINISGFLRPGYSLSRADGVAIEPAGVVALGGELDITYQVSPDEYFFQVLRPDSYLTLVYDDSSSMRSSVKTVKRIMMGYLDNLGDGLYLKLMKYMGEPYSLSDFSKDPAQLKAAMEKAVRGSGNTDTFYGLNSAIKSLQDQNGNKAILAIFDVVDGGGNDHLLKYIELWDSILDSGISFSTIGVQAGWDAKGRFFDNTRRRIFKELAYSTGGQFFHSPTDEKVEQSAEIIFKNLTSPVSYRIKADWTQTETQLGRVVVDFEGGEEKKPTKNVELILDASNSMWGQIQGEAKITIAKAVLNQLIDSLPEDMNVGLRLYGHRYPLNDGRACQDTELVAPIVRIEKTKLKNSVDKITPRGKTPLVFSVLEGIKDFNDIKGGTIVLISDGVESCDGDINSIASALEEAGLDLQVNIVGFDIKEAEARKQLEAIAESTGGVYLDAKDSEELLSSLEQTLKIEFVVLDETGEIKGRGVVGGEPLQLPEGIYTLRLLLQPEPLELSLNVKSGKGTTLFLKRDADKWILIK